MANQFCFVFVFTSVCKAKVISLQYLLVACGGKDVLYVHTMSKHIILIMTSKQKGTFIMV